MYAFKWVLGGAAGGLVGAAVWAAISYFTNYEIAWIAIGIGVLAGLGVRYMAGNDAGAEPGVTASVIAAGAVLLGKYLAAAFLVQHHLGAAVNRPAPTFKNVIAEYAQEIGKERIERGQTHRWRSNINLDTATEERDFPPDVWQEAKDRWAKLQPNAQKAEIDRLHDRAMLAREFFKNQTGLAGAITMGALKASFSLYDLFWFGLAIYTAFKLGSGVEAKRE